MQALILAGGEGTRLRPLTSTIPKPVVPLAGRPFIAYMLDWLRVHGVQEAIVASGFMAEEVKAVLGDGAGLGIHLEYVLEPKPLGTGGALKYAEDLLHDRFLMLNGDVLTDIDLSAQLEQHERTGARATLALVEVDDSSAYGLVRLAQDHAVKEFIEKPISARPPHLINAGVYVLERDVLEHIAPAGTPSSIERDVFPRLVGHGLFGHPASRYWLDIGTPERYLKGTFDLLDGTVQSELLDPGQERGAKAALVERTVAPAMAEPDAEIAAGATVGPYAVVGSGVTVGEGTRIERAVVLDDALIGSGTTISGSIVGPRAQIGDHCRLEEDVVVGEGAVIESGSALPAGARIFPRMVVDAEAIRS
jgi:mannose-1-phosphate guanylyltransferase